VSAKSALGEIASDVRASGYRALRNETEAFRRGRLQASAAPEPTRAGLDCYAFMIAFKGVLLEGLEVAIIVISFGRGEGQVGRRRPTTPPSSPWQAWPPCTRRSRACPRTGSGRRRVAVDDLRQLRPRPQPERRRQSRTFYSRRLL